MTRLTANVAFLLSAFLLPWWVTVFLGIVLLGLWQAYLVVIAGGLIMDFTFGVPLPISLGFLFLYTTLFGILALLTWFLERTVLE